MTEEAKPLTPSQLELLKIIDWSKLNPFKSPRPPVKDVKVPVIKPKPKSN
jgi:hypothetical protein